MTALTVLRPSVVAWSPAALAAIDVVRGRADGAVVTDDLLTDDGRTTSQTTVLTAHGAVVLHSWEAAERLPERHRVFVRQNVNRIRRRLNLPAVTVRYLQPAQWVPGSEILVHDVDRAHPSFDVPSEDGRERVIGGITSRVLPWTILLHVSLAGDDLVRTIAHELRHCDQLWGRAKHVPEADRERDAIAFADAWMAAR